MKPKIKIQDAQELMFRCEPYRNLETSHIERIAAVVSLENALMIERGLKHRINKRGKR